MIAIGLLQSGALDDRALLRRIVQELLAPGGAVILGIPNCRYVDGEVAYGARMKETSRSPELGLLVQGRRVLPGSTSSSTTCRCFVTGRNYIFVTAVI